MLGRLSCRFLCSPRFCPIPFSSSARSRPRACTNLSHCTSRTCRLRSLSSLSDGSCKPRTAPAPRALCSSPNQRLRKLRPRPCTNCRRSRRPGCNNCSRTSSGFSRIATSPCTRIHSTCNEPGISLVAMESVTGWPACPAPPPLMVCSAGLRRRRNTPRPPSSPRSAIESSPMPAANRCPACRRLCTNCYRHTPGNCRHLCPSTMARRNNPSSSLA
mmetsp:Transcript_108827/g.314247  ORF Transcript_108827/g.314247 Transcript_108827/m.314247 type:complete len:216 (+) Transcript_108827:519-1166(+)